MPGMEVGGGGGGPCVESKSAHVIFEDEAKVGEKKIKSFVDKGEFGYLSNHLVYTHMYTPTLEQNSPVGTLPEKEKKINPPNMI